MSPSSLSRRRPMPGILAVLLIVLVLGACASVPVGGGTSGGGPTPTPCTASCPAGQGIQEAQLFVEPTAGEKPVVDAIKSAKQSIDLEMYLLTDSSTIHALEDAAHAGIQVRVMLEPNNHPDKTLAELNAAGVQAKTTNTQYRLTHAKLMVIDQRTALISSANYTKSALGGSRSTSDRDYIVVDTNATDVKESETIFQADWDRTTPALSDPHLLVSPVNSRQRWMDLINSAKSTLQTEQEEMSDPGIINALIAAAKRGVKVEVIVPKPSSNGDSQGEQQLTGAGVQVTQINDRVNHNLYIHAKIIIADGTLAFVGSENVSTASLDDNREIGVLIANTDVIKQLVATFTLDFGK